jgi:hypothetical protein
MRRWACNIGKRSARHDNNFLSFREPISSGRTERGWPVRSRSTARGGESMVAGVEMMHLLVDHLSQRLLPVDARHQ